MTAPAPTSPRFERYLRWRSVVDEPAVELDLAWSGLEDADLEARREAFGRAFEAMRDLEAGERVNVDEDRMVGHYWLRAPERAPTAELAREITATVDRVVEFAAAVHRADAAPPEGGRFEHVLVVGIGGSALGPMLAADALRRPDAPMSVTVLDNTDPEGIDRTVAGLGSLRATLVIVISKSGGTPETRNGMLEIEAACARQGLDFARRAVAVTTEGSRLHTVAREQRWLETFPMWDWVGGRTSELSPVGLLPAALQGADVARLLAGAAAMDRATRREDPRANPAAMLALLWHVEGRSRGERAMVVLPYKDRLLLFSRYLQQLVMESLGKRLDRRENVVHQGLVVYGNKGSTDQHAYVQQLRDGRHDFFVVFVRVLEDRDGPSIEVDDGATSGDFLDGFLQGTRRALFEEGRHSATLTLARLDEATLGALIALFERAVGLYAELIDVNAYHQPGVEAGKKAAATVLALQRRLLAQLGSEPRTAVELAAAIEAEPADCWPILQHLAANRPDVQASGGDPAGTRFSRT